MNFDNNLGFFFSLQFIIELRVDLFISISIDSTISVKYFDNIPIKGYLSLLITLPQISYIFLRLS